MDKHISFSGENLTFQEILVYHTIVNKSLRSYYSGSVQPEFIGYTQKELADELSDRLVENDKKSCLSLLSALEALLRIDYLRSSYDKRKDSISRKMRELYKDKGNKASLEYEILQIWKEDYELQGTVSNIIGALNYRHWLAHGRYWPPKFGRNYDFDYLFALVDQFLEDSGI